MKLSHRFSFSTVLLFCRFSAPVNNLLLKCSDVTKVRHYLSGAAKAGLFLKNTV